MQDVEEFLAEFWAKVAQVNLEKDVPAVEFALGEGETVVGVMTDRLKAIFSVCEQYKVQLWGQCRENSDRLECMQGKRLGEFDPNDLAFAQEHKIAHKRAELLKRVFWQAAEEVFLELLFNENAFSIRDGWRIVTYPREEESVAEVVVLF